jgi:hypothetical protein
MTHSLTHSVTHTHTYIHMHIHAHTHTYPMTLILPPPTHSLTHSLTHSHVPEGDGVLRRETRGGGARHVPTLVPAMQAEVDLYRHHLTRSLTHSLHRTHLFSDWVKHQQQAHSLAHSLTHQLHWTSSNKKRVCEIAKSIAQFTKSNKPYDSRCLCYNLKIIIFLI